MLPSVVRKTRILSYNYESRWHKNASKTRLQICGEELVNAVHDFRKGISDRPLIFIGHSLGGNVIQHVSKILLFVPVPDAPSYLEYVGSDVLGF